MENLYQSPEWSPFSLIGESEVSEASSHTLVVGQIIPYSYSYYKRNIYLTPFPQANTSIGSPAPLEEEFPSQYNNFTGNYHLLQTYGFPSHSSTVRDLVLTISEQRTQIDSLTTAIARRGLEVEELRLREISRHRLGRHEILDAFAERGAMGREEWELVGCETGHHYGDAVEDALLYIRGLRRDYRSVWKRLYAVTPERVMELCMSLTPSFILFHVTYVFNKTKSD